jgi:hypothetical protein
MLHCGVSILITFGLVSEKDGNGAGQVGFWVRSEGSLKLLHHKVNGLSGGGGFERLESTRVVSFTYCMHKGTQEVNSVDGLEVVKEWVIEKFTLIEVFKPSTQRQVHAKSHLACVPSSTPAAWACSA